MIIFSSPCLKGHVSFCHHLASVVCPSVVVRRRPSSVVRRPSTIDILIFSSETTGPIWTKLWWDGPWMVPFQNCIRHPDRQSKMAAVTKNRTKGGWCIKKSSPHKRHGQLNPNFAKMVLGWSSFRIVSDDPTRLPRWPPQPN